MPPAPSGSRQCEAKFNSNNDCNFKNRIASDSQDINESKFTLAEDPQSPLQRLAVLLALVDPPWPTLRLLLLSKEAACERSGLEPAEAAEAIEAAWMLRAERLFCGLDEPRPGKELPRTEEEGAMTPPAPAAAAAAAAGAISSELEAELISRDLLPRPDCGNGFVRDRMVVRDSISKRT